MHEIFWKQAFHQNSSKSSPSNSALHPWVPEHTNNDTQKPLPDPQAEATSAKIQFQRTFLEEANCFSNFLDLGILWFQVSRTIHCQPCGPTKALCLRCFLLHAPKIKGYEASKSSIRMKNFSSFYTFVPKKWRNWGNGDWLAQLWMG